jgi:hypothetical protein
MVVFLHVFGFVFFLKKTNVVLIFFFKVKLSLAKVLTSSPKLCVDPTTQFKMKLSLDQV